MAHLLVAEGRVRSIRSIRVVSAASHSTGNINCKRSSLRVSRLALLIYYSRLPVGSRALCPLTCSEVTLVNLTVD